MMIASATGFEEALASGNTDINLTGSFEGSGFVVDTPGTTINGGGNTITSNDPETAILTLQADNTTVTGVAFNGGGPEGGTDFSNQGIQADNRDGSNIQFNSFTNLGRGYLGVGSQSNLTFSNNTSNNVDATVAINRDVVRSGDRDAFDFGNFQINDNTINGGGFAGITLDAGNDGTDGNPSFPADPNGLRAEATTRQSTVSGSISRNNINAEGFGVALANIDGVGGEGGLTLDSNTIDIAGDRGFGEGLHFEHSTQNVNSTGNNITASGSGTKNGIGVGTFTDSFGGVRDNPASFQNGTNNLSFSDNDATVSGAAGNGFVAGGAENLRFQGENTFQRANPDGSFSNSTLNRPVEGRLSSVAENDGSFRDVPGGPVGESAASPVGESAASPVGESAASPVGESAASPVGESAASPVGESAASPVGESAASPVVSQPV